MNLLWLIKSESYKKGMWLSVLFNILAKAILFLLTVLIAKFFGTNIRTDIYFFVYGTMVLLSGFINNIDTVVLIPQSMRIREQEGAAAATAFLNYFLRIYFLIGLLFVALVYFAGTIIFGWISKFPAADIVLYKNYFLLGSLYFFFQVLTNYINTILASLKFFTVPIIISAINSCVVITGILLLHGSLDVLSVFWGGVAAYSINLVLLLWLLKKNTGWKFAAVAAPGSKEIWHNLVFAQLGQLATLASSFLPLFLLSGFGSGIVSLMNYGKNIADIPNTLITAQLTGVTGVQLNEQAARHDEAGMQQSFDHTAKLLLFLLVPVSCYLFVFARPLVNLFYLRGNFDAAAAEGSARFMQLLSVTIFSTGINALVSRLLIARQAIRQGFQYQVALNVLLILAIWLLTHWYGAYGYPYAIIAINLLNFVLMYFICRKLAPGINYAAVISHTGLLLLVNIPIAAGLYLLASLLPDVSLLAAIIAFFVYLFILIVVNHRFKINPDIDHIIRYATNQRD